MTLFSYVILRAKLSNYEYHKFGLRCFYISG